jgi:hypothetical protein
LIDSKCFNRFSNGKDDNESNFNGISKIQIQVSKKMTDTLEFEMENVEAKLAVENSENEMVVDVPTEIVIISDSENSPIIKDDSLDEPDSPLVEDDVTRSSSRVRQKVSEADKPIKSDTFKRNITDMNDYLPLAFNFDVIPLYTSKSLDQDYWTKIKHSFQSPNTTARQKIKR